MFDCAANGSAKSNKKATQEIAFTARNATLLLCDISQPPSKFIVQSVAPEEPVIPEPEIIRQDRAYSHPDYCDVIIADMS
jgi:hypothetical protein